MRLPPPPIDAVTLAAGARYVPGDLWIASRAAPIPWAPAAPCEALWWSAALRKLHEALWTNALTPGPVIARTIRHDEAARGVTLLVETWGRGVAGAEWGLPFAVLTTLDGLAGCPGGGDLLRLPTATT